MGRFDARDVVAVSSSCWWFIAALSSCLPCASVASDPRVAWSVTTPDSVYATGVLSPDGDLIYIGSMGNKVYALHTSNGAVKWLSLIHI